MSDSKVSMKLLIDTRRKRVLFAEAGKDCVDFLFHILTLPVATVVSLLKAEGMVGSLPNLFKSLEKLNDSFILPDQNKDSYLKPISPVTGSSSVPLLSLTAAEIQRNFYRCRSCHNYVSDDPRAACPLCRSKMSSKATFVDPPAVEVAAEGGGLVKGVVTYMVMDDLVIKPMYFGSKKTKKKKKKKKKKEPLFTILGITMLNKFKVKDVGDLEEKVVYLGMEEALKLLKTSLQSEKVLTDVFYC